MMARSTPSAGRSNLAVAPDHLLNAEDAAVEQMELNRWVQWLRRTLPAIGCDAGT